MKPLNVQFDGVIHTGAWHGPESIVAPPTPGALEWLAEAVGRFQVNIVTVRPSMSVIAWFRNHGLQNSVLQNLGFPKTIEDAARTIDDRAHCFTGTWPTMDELEDFEPWYRAEFATASADDAAPSMEILSKDNQVVLSFGTKVHWVGFPPNQARAWAKAVNAHADSLDPAGARPDPGVTILNRIMQAISDVTHEFNNLPDDKDRPTCGDVAEWISGLAAEYEVQLAVIEKPEGRIKI